MRCAVPCEEAAPFDCAGCPAFAYQPAEHATQRVVVVQPVPEREHHEDRDRPEPVETGFVPDAAVPRHRPRV